MSELSDLYQTLLLNNVNIVQFDFHESIMKAIQIFNYVLNHVINNWPIFLYCKIVFRTLCKGTLHLSTKVSSSFI